MTVVVPEVRAATRAVYAAFILAGVAAASWASRIPQVRDELGLTPSRLGLVLLALAAGSIVSLLIAGQIVARFGSSRTVATMGVLLGVAMFSIAIGYEFGVVPVVIGLFGFGFANGAWDVAMNVQGAIVERRLGKAIMPRFHAGFSVGTVAGALAGAAAVALGLSVTVHLAVTAVLIAVVVVFSVRAFVPDDAGPVPTVTPSDPTMIASNPPVVTKRDRFRNAVSTWREPRTILVGVFVLAFAFTEGAGIDWISVSMIDSYGTSAAVGTLAFALFLSAMTAGRWFGPALLDRYGRVPVVRVLAAVSLGGLALYILGPGAPYAFLGALLWGLGASLGFPVGMSAAADDPAHAASRVSVVASIGYCAFLGGPPLIGFLGDHMTVKNALVAVAVLLIVSLTLAGAVKPLPEASLEEERLG
ncbi:MFS transporter [Paractinoplanes abujensis]|uniref:Putative MFS family arabinose efflux permease n=1 Tax=Paractinoplanes abujensis TaxID=882441 RepID=A0A7W7CZ94_9ACTN|nr:MFS transporter [Actinoplanes abujensis]MBB4695751.1 putative MFS family arabinose efflux permease [Actinoplanes abujensis]GID23335.1 MFS transporter [Actinoplanes abujensis]